MEAAISDGVGQRLCAAKETSGFCPLLFQGFAKCKGLQGTSNDLIYKKYYSCLNRDMTCSHYILGHYLSYY